MLKLENISKYYYSSSSVTCALRKINLEFELGEFVSITGESGSGKSTLLNLISGLDSYEDGELYINGRQTSYFDAGDWEKYRKEEIAFIFQNYNLIDSFTVLENVVVTYLIDGYSMKEAKRLAKEKLKLVGLEKDSYKKAIKLSGGQKQRLSIARALAKETKIIIADEPTGNLDSENGLAILSLLKELSKQKLVIVVTHNQAQIEPFQTRKIRLHDGEVVEDVKITKPVVKEDGVEVSNKKNIYKSAFNFSLLNIKAQPKKSILVFMLVLLCTLTSFVFLGNFKMNLDENKTKNLETSMFLNLDETRMLVKNSDNLTITPELLNQARVKNVLSIEPFDYITDVNYYRLGDYKIVHKGGFVDTPDKMDTNFVDMSTIDFVDHSKFMRSTYSLSSDMLKAGRLPENDFEMVVYSDDLSVLDTIECVYFRNARLWGEDTSYKYDVKIVGILKERTDQVYFSDLICKILDISHYQFQVSINYKFQFKTLSKYFRSIVVDPKIKEGYDLSFDKATRELLQGENITILKKDNAAIHIEGKATTQTYNFDLSHANEVSSLATLGVSKEVFEHIYENFKDKKQFAIFVNDYAYIDEISSDLIAKGFETLSCFRASVTGYNHQKVTNQYVNLLISVVGVIFINLLTILVGYSILRVKKNDYIIFKMIGLENRLSSKINFIEVFFYGVLANIILIILAFVVKTNVEHELIVEMFKHIKFYDYLITLVIVLISMYGLGHKFNKYIKKSAKVTVLKEE